jgi:hypothetical protein
LSSRRPLASGRALATTLPTLRFPGLLRLLGDAGDAASAAH